MSDIVLGNIGSGFNRSKINSNFDKIEDVINNGVLHLVGGNNVLQQNIDMDSNRIVNLPEALNNTEPVTLKQLNDSLAGIEGAEALLPLVQPRQVGDGVTTTFSTPVSGQAGKSTNGFFVYLDGVYQRPNIDYTVDSGNGNLTFVEASTPVAPNSGVNIDITYFIPKVIDTVTADENSLVTATDTTTAISLGDSFSDFLNVKRMGVIGDGSTDDTTAMQAAVNLGGNILIDGQILVSERIIVPSNTRILQTKGSWIKSTDSTETTIGGRPSTDNGVFQIECGSTNISFEGLDIRGPFYGVARPYRDNNIGINISGRFDQHRLSLPLTGVSTRVLIKDCVIDGFGQSAVIADNVTRLKVLDNFFQNCGREGLRMYGCVDFLVQGNSVVNMSPGYDGISPNLNVYGISATTVYQTPLADFRPSEDGVIDSNIVANCTTWKSLDTHGGRNITFSNNQCKGSHIGLGIDKGGYDDALNLMPAENILVTGNSFINRNADLSLRRAGISVFAHGSDDIQIGKDITIVGNHIEGYGGQTKDGGISISQQRNVTISGNNFVDCIYSGVFVALSSQSTVISNNTFRNIIESGSGVKNAITTSSAIGKITINGNSFVSDNGLPFTTVSIPNSANVDIYYGADNIEDSTSGASGLLFSTGGEVTKSIAYINVLGSNGNSLGGYNATCSRVSVGRYDIVITNMPSSKIFPILSVTTDGLSNDTAAIRSVVGSTITVLTKSDGTLSDLSFYLEVKGY